jgi:hypothetical protein
LERYDQVDVPPHKFDLDGRALFEKLGVESKEPVANHTRIGLFLEADCRFRGDEFTKTLPHIGCKRVALPLPK